MIVNKKLDRLKQWGRERMGGEVKTDTSDEFKGLQMEMQLRQDGMLKTTCWHQSTEELTSARHGPLAALRNRVHQVAGPPRSRRR